MSYTWTPPDQPPPQGPPDEHARFGPDGWLDLTVKFDKKAIVEALGDVQDGDVLVITVSGNLLPEHGGMQILGEDVIVILK